MSSTELRAWVPKSFRSVHWSQVGVLLTTLLVGSSCTLWAQAPDSHASEANKAWTNTTESQTANVNPTRTVDSHSQTGNRTVDTKSTLRKGFDGHYEPYIDVEKETVQVDASTVRTVTRTFNRDSNGEKKLVQVTEEERHTLPGGESNAVRTTSNADLDGRLQVVQRETEKIKKTSANVEEKETSVSLRGADGMTPAMKVQERRTRGENDTVESQKTTFLPDGSGNWQVQEVRQGMERAGKNPTVEERVSRTDGEGNLREISRTVSKQVESASGEKHNTVETYSADVPGAARDGGLHVVERTTTVEHTDLGGQKIVQQQVEQANPGDPSAGLRVTVITSGTTSTGVSGTQATRTIQTRDANGNFGTVSVDVSKSNEAHTIQVKPAPSEKPK